MFPKSLQGRFIFLFGTLIFITNAFLAVGGFSRERIAMAEDAMNSAVSMGNLLRRPAQQFLASGQSEALDNIFTGRSGVDAELKLTLYDSNWWKKWGDDARVPPAGFPDINTVVDLESHAGSGQTYREVFFKVVVDGNLAGMIGVGIPAVWQQRAGESAGAFGRLLVLSMILGLLVAVFASNSILEPLNDLMTGIDEFGRGDYSVRVQAKGTGELKNLGDSFNRMAVTVQETFKENLVRNRANDEKLQELWEIYELMRKMTLHIEFREILEKFLEKAQTLSFSSFGQIVLQNRRNLRFEGVVNVHGEKFLKDSLLENVVNNCFLSRSIGETQFEGVSIICIPLLAGQRMNGVMLLAKNDAGGYSEGVRRFLETIAPVLAALVENASLYDELSEWNHWMKNILASITQGLVAVDFKKRFLVGNEQMSAMFGIRGFDFATNGLDEFCGRLADQTFAAALLAEVAAYSSPVHASAVVQQKSEKIFPYDDGQSHRQIKMQLFPLLEETELKGCVLSVEDVTDQKKVEQQMLETEKWAVMGRLAASVAHEIRNPLVAIRSLVEIIGEEVEGQLKEHAKVILGEVLRLNRVVAELLSLVRPEKATLHNCNLVDLINELLLLVRYEAARNEIKLNKNFCCEKCLVPIDPEKIKQALLNILLNAYQAVDKGGNVDIGLEILEHFAVITVGNDGPAIDEAIRGKIFEPFFTTKSNGTGLGLAITCKIAELHGGRVECDSRPGRTEFRFYIPDGVCNG